MLNTITKKQLNRFNQRGVNIIQNKKGKLLTVNTNALESLPSCYEPIKDAKKPLTSLRREETREANNSSSETQSNVLTNLFQSFKHVYSSYSEDLTQ